MRDHPLTPMTDANLVRVLQAQMPSARVGLIDHASWRRRRRHPRRASRALQRRGRRASRSSMRSPTPTCWRLAAALRRPAAGDGRLGRGDRPAAELRHSRPERARPPAACRRAARAAIVSGSCSAATNAQVAALHRRRRVPALRGRSACGSPQATDVVGEALAWAARAARRRGPVLIYATAEPDGVQAVQARLGVRATPARWSSTRWRAIARGLVERGVRQLVVAGGETSGACVQALGVDAAADRPRRSIRACRGATPAPPAGGDGLHLALKSGNFGGDRLLQPRPSTLPGDERPHDAGLARGDLPRRPLAVRARLRACDRRQHQRAPRRRLPDHADRCLPGHSRPGAARPASSATAASSAAIRPARRWRCIARIYAADPEARCVIHTHSTHCVALTPGRRLVPAMRPAADHAVLRDEGRPRAADPVPPPGRRRGRRRGRRGDRRAAARAAADPRAVLLERLGPNVWHRTPAAGEGRARGAGGDGAAVAALRAAAGSARCGPAGRTRAPLRRGLVGRPFRPSSGCAPRRRSPRPR